MNSSSNLINALFIFVLAGFIAVVAATSNIVGGFLITDRMLKMFKSSRPAVTPAAKSVGK